MRHIFNVAVSILFCLIISGPALAVDSPTYFGGNLGGFIPTGDLEGEDTSITGNIHGGHYFTENVALEFGIGGVFSSYSDEGEDRDGDYFEEDSYIEVVPLTISVKVLLPVSDNVEFYGGLGIGTYVATYKAEVYYPDLDLEFEDTDRDTVFGGHTILGANFYPSGSGAVFINLQAKYTVTDEASFSIRDYDRGYVYRERVRTDLDGLGLMAGVGFRF